MKVRFLKVMAGPKVLHIVGEEVEMEEAKAKRFIEHGVCELVEVAKVKKLRKTKKSK